MFEAQSLVSLPIGDLAGANDLFRFTEECVLSQMYMPGYPLPQAANLIATDTEALTIWRRTLAKKIAKLSSKLKNS